MTLLAARGVSISFGGLRALDDVSIDVDAGSITALIGPNGAGKTTLFAALAGFLRPSAGRVALEGRDVTGLPPHRIAALGMTRTFQIVQPFAGQTVRENVAVGAHLRLASRARALAVADEVAGAVGLASQLDKPASDLTVAGRVIAVLGPAPVDLDEVVRATGLAPHAVRGALLELALAGRIEQHGQNLVSLKAEPPPG